MNANVLSQPFREQYPVNPSWEIASRLPSHLPPLRAKDPNSRHVTQLVPKVRILVHPEPIRVNYKVVRSLVPTFYETYHGRKVDIVIHIGMAGLRPYYCIERTGHRDGYKHPDVDGEKLGDEEERQNPDDHGIWSGLPEKIKTDLDVEDVLARWQGHSAVSTPTVIHGGWTKKRKLTWMDRYRTTLTYASRRTQATTSATSSTTRVFRNFTRPSDPERQFSFMCPPMLRIIV